MESSVVAQTAHVAVSPLFIIIFVVIGLIVFTAVVAGIIIAVVVHSKKTKENNNFSLWLRSVEQRGLAERIPVDADLAVKLYYENPGKKTFEYIQRLNPHAGVIISSGSASAAVQYSRPIG